MDRTQRVEVVAGLRRPETTIDQRRVDTVA
jgi:hypothetical protein